MFWLLRYAVSERITAKELISELSRCDTRWASMNRLKTKIVRPSHGGRMGGNYGKEDPVVLDRLRAEDFVLTKVWNQNCYK